MTDHPTPPAKPFRPPRGARPAARDVEVTKPEFPPGAEVHLPRRVRTELRQGMKDAKAAEDVMLALTLAAAAIDDDEPQEALPYLLWAKTIAQRSPSIREALGVAHYLSGNYQAALTELRTYRRLAATADQNHLVADCLRGLGHPVADVAEAIGELLDAPDVEAERKVEGLLVWAGALADHGDVQAAKAVMRRASREMLDAAGSEARERFQYLAGELAMQAGDTDKARAAWAPLAQLEDDPYGLRERLDELG